METYRLLCVIIVVLSPLGSTAQNTSKPFKPECRGLHKVVRRLLRGEQFSFMPDEMGENLSNDEVKWYRHRNDSVIEPITPDQNQDVHYQGGALFFMNVTLEDSGTYTAVEDTAAGCYEHPVEIQVLTAANHKSLLYIEIKNSDPNKRIECPDPVSNICSRMNGTMSWMKDFKDDLGHSGNVLSVNSASKDNEGIYTCVCTWWYNQRNCTSSASRKLTLLEQASHTEPRILSPSSDRVFVDGDSVHLECSVLCGKNHLDCSAKWEVSRPGEYSQNQTRYIEKGSTNSIAKAVLYIQSVSDRDLSSEFTCFGKGSTETINKTVTLVRRDSYLRTVIVFACVLFTATLVLVKCFAVDLALLFRPWLSWMNHNQDARTYDAYVVYQMRHLDRPTEDALCQFITSALPSVLEDECGYRLFIQGRDDTPGEDHLELVEGRMKESKRLIAILTPKSEPDVADRSPTLSQTEAMAEFDWQVGLHHVLVQGEMSVILIQIGEMGPDEYKHFPLSLQHLIEVSAPIRWNAGSHCAAVRYSRFWKKVRYLMPAVPATKSKQYRIC